MNPAPPRFELAPGYDICPVVVGCWQLSEGHGGSFDRRTTLESLLGLAEAGFDTFDVADIYTGVEELLGELVDLAKTTSAPPALRLHTKIVPDLEDLASLCRSDVEAVIDRSLQRLRVERLDLVQFHWWDFDIPGCTDAAVWLDDLRRAGKIRHLGVTNFDCEHLEPILDAGVPIVSNQVQYSLLDRRPERSLTALCESRDLHLLAYGSLAGGFLSHRWLGASDPGSDPGNRSLVKYRLILEEIGGWPVLQRLLARLAEIADRREAKLADVAMRWVLDRPGVAGILSGFSARSAAQRLAGAMQMKLDAEGLGEIEDYLENLGTVPGEVFEQERIRGGRHAAIMKTNLQDPEP